MKLKAYNVIIFLLVAMLPLAAPAQSYKLKSQSIVISGTSNLHDWTADVEKVNGHFSLKVDNGKLSAIQAVNLRFDANSLKGSKGSIMNSKIIDALKSKKFPYITFTSTGGTVNEKSGAYKVVTTGILTIAGNSQNVTVDATGKVLPNGDIEFTGSRKLKMTEYKVVPPKAMLGTLTTGDDITITFKIVLQIT